MLHTGKADRNKSRLGRGEVSVKLMEGPSLWSYLTEVPSHWAVRKGIKEMGLMKESGIYIACFASGSSVSCLAADAMSLQHKHHLCLVKWMEAVQTQHILTTDPCSPYARRRRLIFFLFLESVITFHASFFVPVPIYASEHPRGKHWSSALSSPADQDGVVNQLGFWALLRLAVGYRTCQGLSGWKCTAISGKWLTVPTVFLAGATPPLCHVCCLGRVDFSPCPSWPLSRLFHTISFSTLATTQPGFLGCLQKLHLLQLRT